MKIRYFIAALLLASSIAALFAADACVQYCQQTLKAAIELCNYPEKEPAALRECLDKARKNFDACKANCGR
jgi:hypothetical protein